MEEQLFKKRNVNKFYSGTEIITSHYFKGEKEIEMLVASDIHYHPRVDKEIFKLLVKYCRETSPDFIVIPGDILETINFIDDLEEKKFFERIIEELAEISPVIIVPGNHEVGTFDIDKASNRSYIENTKALNYLSSLSRIKNVYFLNNEQTSIKGVTFLGFSPRLATYLKKGDKRTNEMFMEDYLRSGLKMAEADYNILVTHSPIILSEPEVVKNVDDFNYLTDLVISGHLHDGYLPKGLDKFLGNTSVGLFFTPLVAPYPGMVCRGVHDFGRGYLFISQGFRKYTADIGLFNAFEKITANDVEQLIIRNPEIIFDESKVKKVRK